MPAREYRTSIEIEAPPAVVYPYFTEPRSILRWMGDYVVADARPGGEFTADINGIPIRGHYVELDPPTRVVITWGHAGSDVMPPGSSTVEVILEPHNGGTRLQLVHRDLPLEDAGMHATGWEHYLPRLAIAAPGGEPGADPWATEPPIIPESFRRWSPSALH